MTAGRKAKEPKWPVRLDGDIRRWVAEMMTTHPDLWRSERAAVHEVLRRGMLTFTAAPAAPVPPKMDSPEAGALPRVEEPTLTAPPARALSKRSRESTSPSSFGWTPETVRCGRCGKDVSTAAAARAAHFKTCPPDLEPELDVAGLAAEFRARVLEGPPGVPGRTPREVQLAIVKDLAHGRGFEIGDVVAAEILERVLERASSVHGEE